MQALQAKLEGSVGTLQISVEIECRAGSLVLIGPNGSGKSSILRMLLGALSPRDGRICVGEHVLFDRSANIDVPMEQRALGIVPQSYGLFPHMRVREIIDFALDSIRDGERRDRCRDRARQVLDELQVTPLMDRHVTSLSGGERQRVALARALCVAPRALLLDEPLSAFDIVARRAARAFLAKYLAKLDVPSLVVTHDASDAMQLGATLCVIEHGRIVQHGSWQDLVARPASAYVEALVASAPAAPR